MPQCRIEYNTDGMILTRVHQNVIEMLWNVYHPMVELGADEAAALYQAAVSYFRGEAVRGQPVPPIIVEVDMMLSFGGMTREERRSITYSDMERMQLIRSARADALGLNGSAVKKRAVPSFAERDFINEEASSFPAHMFPPERERAMRMLDKAPGRK